MKKCNRLAVAHVKAVFLFFQISVRENVRYTGLSDTPNPQETIPAEVPRSREGRRQKSLRVEKKRADGIDDHDKREERKRKGRRAKDKEEGKFATREGKGKK